MLDPPGHPPAAVSQTRHPTPPVSDPSRLARHGRSSARRNPLLGTLARWVQLARPAGVWIPPLLPLLGYGWAHWERALPAWQPVSMVWLAAAWVALQAGTLWMNAARDQDDGEVLFGRAVSVPPGTAWLGLASALVAVALAGGAGWPSMAIAAVCAVLAVLYSHPATKWKAHPVLGPLVNVVGYGVLSPLAGYVVVGGAPTPRGAVTLALLAATALGWTFAAQAFQGDEDRARGDRTLVVTAGPAVTLTAARVCLGVAGLGVLGMAVIGWLPRPLLIAAPALLLGDLHLARWAREPNGGTERWARRQAWLGITFGLLCVVGAGAAYVADDLNGRPVAGLGTAAGHPHDRLLLPAAFLAPLDARDRNEIGRAYRAR